MKQLLAYCLGESISLNPRGVKEERRVVLLVNAESGVVETAAGQVLLIHPDFPVGIEISIETAVTLGWARLADGGGSGRSQASDPGGRSARRAGRRPVHGE